MTLKHVMLDLETLGTTADSVILSIGGCKFSLEDGTIDDAGFYASISIESNLVYNRRVQEDTLIWWFKQPAAAQAVFHEPKQTLESALDELAEWVEDPNVTVWSNGADFDIPMLAHAYRQCGIDIPWKFWNARCVRTYKNLPVQQPKLARTGTHHNALADAVYQAKLVHEVHKALKARVAA